MVVQPEHAPPINNSPWYAFRYEADAGPDVRLTLHYQGAPHRYPPEWRSEGELRLPDIDVSEDGATASFALPPGSATVSAQELFGQERYSAALARLASQPNASHLALGFSHDGRVVEAVTLGDHDAPHVVVLLGRAHPPEVSGAVAMESFVERIAETMTASEPDFSQFQFLIVPLLNPDGVARGHWRANLGGTDLNRDWGIFTQPETRGVKAWLDALPVGVAPIAMIDFHSTDRNLFYVQGPADTDEQQEQFLTEWLVPLSDALPGYPFTIERRNANPDSGTSKNWFNATYGIPAYTFEVGDETDRDVAAQSARALASRFLQSLGILTGDP